MCFLVRSSILICLDTKANSEGYFSKEFIEVDNQKSHLWLGSRVTQTMDLFDQETIHFERGPSLAFQQIGKISHRNKDPKIYVPPIAGVPPAKSSIDPNKDCKKYWQACRKEGECRKDHHL